METCYCTPYGVLVLEYCYCREREKERKKERVRKRERKREMHRERIVLRSQYSTPYRKYCIYLRTALLVQSRYCRVHRKIRLHTRTRTYRYSY